MENLENRIDSVVKSVDGLKLLTEANQKMLNCLLEKEKRKKNVTFEDHSYGKTEEGETEILFKSSETGYLPGKDEPMWPLLSSGSQG